MTLHPILDGIEVVVFDKDGTLISFEAMWVGWTRELGGRLEAATRRPVAGDVFATIGFDPTRDRVIPGGPLATATMDGIRDLVGAVLRRWCPSVPAAMRILSEAWFEPDPVATAVPLADLPGVLGAIRASGRRIAIATTDDRRPTEATLAGLGLAELVDDVVCGDDAGPTKPDPATIAAIGRRLSAPADRIAMVGDTPADLRMAREAGARTVGVTSGVTGVAELGPWADAILGSIAELIAGG
ncbi:MAG TPA: HAD family hydrolase [Candidatus Limnocylindrales bacterium]|nr:HAD family hydrolase [Candidatus Limnocylindrales bacterium]